MGTWRIRRFAPRGLGARRAVVVFACAALVVSACGRSASGPEPAQTQPDASRIAEVIYRNGVVITMAEGPGTAQALATRDGLIVAVGSDEEVLALAGEGTRVVDLGGRTLMPGFIDSHAHWIGDGPMVGYDAGAAIDAALQRGWTSISELFVDEGRLTDLRALDRAGRLRLRVNAYLPVNFQDDKFGTWFLDYEPHHAYSPYLRLGGVKLFLDHGWGTTFHWNQAELDEYVAIAHSNGWQVTAHTISAEALDQFLTAIEHALSEHPDPQARHRVEHAIQVRDDQLVRMRELGLIASIQPGIPGDSASEDGYQEMLARGEPGWIARWRDMVEAGIPVIGSTDFPWLVLILGDSATDMPHGSPLEAVYEAVTRESYLGRPPEDWQMRQTLTVAQAIRMFTVDAAYGTFEEDVKGSLSPGKYADLVILSDNPMTVPIDVLPEVQVLATVVGGKTEYCAPASSALC